MTRYLFRQNLGSSVYVVVSNYVLVNSLDNFTQSEIETIKSKHPDYV